MSTQIPSVGRDVHYQSYGTPGGEYLPEPRTAKITTVNDAAKGDVGLCVFNPTGLFFNLGVPFAEVPTPGHWNWPPRVDAPTMSIYNISESASARETAIEVTRLQAQGL